MRICVLVMLVALASFGDAQTPSDPDLSAALSKYCNAEFQPSLASLCRPPDGSPTSGSCLSVGRQLTACIKQTISWGAIYPKYLVVGVLYSPPGCTTTSTLKCSSNSTVQYETDSSLGTKVSISSSIKREDSIKSGFQLSFPGIGSIGSTQQDQFSTTTADTESIGIVKSKSSKLQATGNGDGINHDQDTILLMLNPAIAVGKVYNLMSWRLGYTGSSPIPYELTVSYLKDPSTIPVNVRKTLTDAGITDADLKIMLQRDPLADLDHPPTANDLDKSRFANVTTFDYLPLVPSEHCNGGVCSCMQVSKDFKNSMSVETSQQIVNSHDNSYSISATFKPSDPLHSDPSATGFSADFTDTQSLTVTSGTTNTNSVSDSNSASVSISCPSSSWSGQTLVDVYWDGVYGSFAFLLRDLLPTQKLLFTQPIHETGSGAFGKKSVMPIGKLIYGGQILNGVIDRDGNLKFYGVPDKNLKEGALLMGDARQAIKVKIAD